MIPFLQLKIPLSYSWRRGFSLLCLRNAVSLPSVPIQSLEETTLVILAMLPRLMWVSFALGHPVPVFTGHLLSPIQCFLTSTWSHLWDRTFFNQHGKRYLIMCPIIFETSTYLHLSLSLSLPDPFLLVRVCVRVHSVSLCVSDSSSRLSERWSLIHADWFWLCLQSSLDCFYIHCIIFSFVRSQRSIFRLCPFLLFNFSLFSAFLTYATGWTLSAIVLTAYFLLSFVYMDGRSECL